MISSRFRVASFLVAVLVLIAAPLAGQNGPEAGELRGTVPVVGSTPGAFGAQFRTELQLTNPGEETARGWLVLRPAGGSGATDPFLEYELAPHETITFADIVAELGHEGLGSLDLVVGSGVTPVVVARAFDDDPEGTKGVMLPLFLPEEATARGETTALVIPADLGGFRFNIGVRALGDGATLGMSVFDAAGELVHEAGRLSHPRHWFEQRPAADRLGLDVLPEGGLVLVRVYEGAAFVYGTTTDNRTNDPSIQIEVNLLSPLELVEDAVVDVTVLPGTTTTLRLQLPDAGSLVSTIISGPAEGTVRAFRQGASKQIEIEYEPREGYEGPDEIVILVEDAFGRFAEITIRILVMAKANEAPRADDASVETAQNTPVEITLEGSDPEGEALEFTIVSQPLHGVLTGLAIDGDARARVRYMPNQDFHGSDSFTFRVTDPHGLSATATVSITVNAPGNTAPVANDQFVTTDQDTPVGITLTGSDADGDPLTFAVATTPANGALTGTAPNVTYTPNAGFTGNDSFTFTVNDGTVASTPATVSITVNALGNTAPVANDQSVTTDRDTPVAITLTGSDPDGDAITFDVQSTPASGTLTGTAPNLTYTPNAGFTGNDSFTFVVNDGTVDSAPATVSITVNTPGNTAPAAHSQSVTTMRDAAVAITLTGSDPDADPISFSVTSTPANGTLTGTPPDLTYTPKAGFTGNDSFTFTVNDGTVDSAPATVSITVNAPGNNAPVANSQSVTTTQGTPVEITLTGSDPDGDPISYSLTSTPADGTLTGTAPNLTYSPAPGFTGNDSFTFVVNDGTVDSVPATVSITVNAPDNSVPVASDDSYSTDEDATLNVAAPGVLANDTDADGDTLTAAVVSSTLHGVLTLEANGSFTYVPAPDYFGTDSFTYRASDGTVESNTATVTITIEPVNDPPSFTKGPDQTIDSTGGGVRTVAGWASNLSPGPANESDQTLTFVVTGNDNAALFGAGPAISGTSGDLTFTPVADAQGVATITIVLQDDGGTDRGGIDTSAPQSFTIQMDAAPRVVSTVPAAGAAASPSTLITINFNEIVEANTGSFELQCPAATPVAFTLSASPSSSFTLTPAASLPPGVDCQVRVLASEISDVDTFDPPDQMSADHLFTFTVAAGGAATSTISADPSSIVADGTSTSLITVQLKDGDGTDMTTSGGVVTLSTTDGTLSAVTDHNDGTYTATLTSSTTAGAATVSGTINGSPMVNTATVSFTAGPGARYLVESSGFSAVAGSSVTITAQLVDANDNPVATENLTVSWSSTGGGSFGAASSLTNASGLATVSFTTATAAGTVHTVTADDGTSNGTSADITTVAGAAAKYLVSSSEFSPVAGSSVTITAQLADANDNPVATENVTVGWSSTNGGSFGAASSLTDATGVATVSFTTATTARTVHTVTADDGTSTGTSADITTVVGAAAKYLVSSSDSSPVAGSAVTITAQLADANDNPVATENVTVSWSSTNGGTFADPSSLTNASGLATVSFTTSTTAGTEHTVTANDGTFTGTSANITPVAGAAAKYLVSSSDFSPAAGSSVTITAQLADANDNPVATENVTVSWSSTGGGSFGAASSLTNASGLATVSFTTAATAGATHTVTADDGTNTGTSGDITTAAGAAAKYLVSSSDFAPAAGSTVTITAQLADANDNPVATENVSVNWSSTNGGSLGSASSLTDATGLATVSFTTSTTAGTVHTVTADDGTSSGTSADITTVVGAVSLTGTTITADPGSIVADGTSTSTITVQLRDQHGNAIVTSGGAVVLSTTGGTLSNGVDSGASVTATDNSDGTYSATLTSPATSGSATISGTLAGDALTDTATVTFTHGALDAFVVEAAGGGAIGTQQVDVAFAIQITAVDANLNTVETFDGTVDISSTTATFAAGDGTTAAFTDGVLASHSVTISNGGTHQIVATRTGGTETGSSNSFLVDAPPEVVSTVPADAAVDVAVATTITVNFSESVTATGASFEIRCPSTNPTLHAYSLSGSPASSYTLTPTTNLPGGTTCEVTVVGAEIVDDALLTMETDHVFSFTTVPVATNDTYPQTVVGNVPVDSNRITYSVLDNDEFDGTVTISAFDATTTEGGTVVMTTSGAGVGEFTYAPPPGFEGNDTFTYTLSVGGSTASATVTIPVSGMIWFVDAAAAAGGNGTLGSPFNCLVGAGCFNLSANEVGDNIFLYAGSYTAGLTLKNNQKLIGQGSSTTLAAIAGVTVPTSSDALPALNGNESTVTISGGAHAVTLGQGNTLRGFTIGDTPGFIGLRGDTFGTLSISEVTINGTGAIANLNNGSFGAGAALTSITSTSSSGAGLSLTGIGSGTLAIGSTSISGSTSQGIVFSGSGAAVNFGNTTVSAGTIGVALATNSGSASFGTLGITGGSGIGLSHDGGGSLSVTGATTVTNPAGTGIDIRSLALATPVSFAATTINKNATAGIGVSLGGAATGNAANVTFASLAITTSNGTALLGVNNTGSIIVTTNGGSISATGGPAVNINNATTVAPISLNLGNVSSTNSSTTGINLLRVSGSLNTTGGTISGPNQEAVKVATSTANVTYAGPINKTSAGIGIDVQGQTAGTVTFSGTTKTLTTSTGNAVNLVGNNGGTIVFSNGGLAISTTSGIGFNATGGGTVSVTTGASNNTIVSTTGTAVNIVGTTIGGTGVTFASVSNNGAANGIVIDNAGGGFFTANGGTITGALTRGVRVNLGNGNVTYAGAVSTNLGASRSVEVSNRTGGTVTLSGAVTDTSLGVSLTGNNAATVVTFSNNLSLSTGGNTAFTATGAGTVNLSGTTKNLTPSTGTGITLNGVTVNISNGNLAIAPSGSGQGVVISGGTTSIAGTTNGVAITTGTGAGLTATSGGTLAVTGSVNTISATGGVALNVQNTNIGASGLTFRSISANGGANGIVLVSTGTSGGLTVTGNSSGNCGGIANPFGAATPPNAADCTGGTIEGSAGSDGATAGNGIYLFQTSNVSLTRMRLRNTANNGLRGTGVRGLLLDRLLFDGTHGTSNSGTFDEAAVNLNDLGGIVSITNSTLNGGAYNAMGVENMSGTNPSLNIVLDGNTISHMQGSTVDSRNTAFRLNLGDGVLDARIRNNRVTFWWANAIHVLTHGTASGTSRITGNFAHNTNGALAGAGGIWITGCNATFHISGNAVRNTNGTAISADKGNCADTTFQGTIDSNTIGVSGVANSGSFTGIGIFAAARNGTTTVKISNNTLRQINGSANGAVTAVAGDNVAFSPSGTMNATITGNNIQESGTTVNNAQQGILITHGTTSSGASDSHLGCYDILNNTIVNFTSGSANNRIRVNQRFSTTSRWPGYTGAATGATSTTDMAAYLLARNTASTSTNANSSTGGFLPTVPAGSQCVQPAVLSLP